MKKIFLAAIAALAFASPAYAEEKILFQFEGETWAVLGSADGAGVARNMMTPGAAKTCPSRTVRQEAKPRNTGGPSMAMTPEQRFRGDNRHHVVCVFRPPPRQEERR